MPDRVATMHETHEIDGIAYRVARHGSPGAPRLLLVHGFMGRADGWRELIGALEGRFDLLAVDLPGHGGTPAPAAPARAGVEETADDLAAILDGLDAGPIAVIGYSLGARIALRLALDHPRLVGRLVLESPSPGIDGDAERAARRDADEALASALERDGIEAFVTAWEAQPLFASQAALPDDRREFVRTERLANDPHGLAVSLRGAGQGSMEPLTARLAAATVPALVIAGGLDPVGRRRAEAVARGIPGARLAVVPDAGHRVHLERPLVYRRLVTDFLKEIPAA